MAKENKKEESVDTTHVGESLQPEGGLEQFLETHIKKILAVVLVAAIGAGAWIFIKESGKAREAEAAKSFTSASTESDLEMVSTQHSGTVAGGNALLMIADRNVTTGKFEDARIRLDEFLKNYPDHPRVPQAQFSLGVVAETSGKPKEAEEHFQAVADSGSELGPLALVRVANLQASAGDPKKAKTTLDGVMGRFVGNPFIELVASRRDSVKRQIALSDNPPPPYEWPEPPMEDESKSGSAKEGEMPAPELSTLPVPPGSVPEGTSSTSAIEIPALSDLDNKPEKPKKPKKDGEENLLSPGKKSDSGGEAPPESKEDSNEAGEESAEAPQDDPGGDSRGD